MISSIEIENFKCFQKLEIDKCRRINVVVGENGCGKTALLEAIFVALASSPEVILRFRSQRGHEGNYSSQTKDIEEAVVRDLFYANDWSGVISVKLNGTGPEARSVRVFREANATKSIPFEEDKDGSSDFNVPTRGVRFLWKSADTREYDSFLKVTPKGFEFEQTAEDVPDFFYVSSMHATNSRENANRFSKLSRVGRSEQFVKIFTDEFDWLEGLSIEVDAGNPLLYASVKGQKDKVALPNISAGLNRMIGVMLSIASRQNSVVLVDEIENGLYYSHQSEIWRGLLSLVSDHNGQIFLTTHSEEWLNALVDAAGEHYEDIALWRVERDRNNFPVVRQFIGDQVILGIKAGEVR
ncbi:MAG: AAA family ATPase [Pseudomonadota bacterium]